MKRRDFEHFIHCLVSIMLAVLLFSCTEEDAVDPTPQEEEIVTPDSPDSPDSPEEESQEEDSTIDIVDIVDSDGNSLSDNDDPVVVSDTEATTLTMQQKSTYYDVDGTIYTVAPISTISADLAFEAITVGSIDELVNITTHDPITDSTTENDLCTCTTQQIFEIAGQRITFDTSHEIYTYTNSADQEIEMPYIEVKTPQFGNSSEESTTKSSSDYIKLVKVETTRATVTTEEEYEVTATFTVDVASVNSSTDYSKTIEFEVTYSGTVTTDTEVDDSYNTLSYTVTNGSANVSNTTSFTISNTDLFSLEFYQTAKYIDYTGATLNTTNPVANIAIQMSESSVAADDYESIVNCNYNEQTGEEEGENPQTSKLEQTFGIGDQKVTFTLTDEMYTYDGVDMAYLKLSEVNLQEISAEEVTTKATVTDTKTYNVTATFSVTVESQNIEDSFSETYTFKVTYPATVTTETEVADPYNTLSYTVTNGSANVSGTTSFTISDTDQFDLEFYQTAKYIDYTGATLNTTNPVANIAIQMSESSVAADSYDSMIYPRSGDDISESGGENPYTTKNEQWFSIGDQRFSFTLTDEMYTYDGVEMAYLKVGSYEYIGVSAEEVTTKATVTNTKNYNVTATFSVTVASQNIEDNFSETYTFELTYPATVTTETEVADPYNTLDYTVTKNSSSVGSTTSFTISDTDQFDLEFYQTAKYIDYTGATLNTTNPVANIAIQMSESSVTADSYGYIVSYNGSDQSYNDGGENPYTTKNEQWFSIGDQRFSFTLTDEMYTYDGVDMAYLKLSEVNLQEISAEEVTTKATVTDTKTYNVTATFSVTVESQNIEDSFSETYTFKVTYPATVTTKTEVDDPYTTLDYSVKKDGSSVSSSSFTISDTEATNIIFDQTAKYVDYTDTAICSIDLEAVISAQMASTSVNITDGDTVESSVGTPTTTTSSNGATHTETDCKFTIGEQELSFTISDEMFAYEGIDMAYLKVGTPQYVSITADEVSTNDDDNTVNYDVVATFTVDVESQNLDDNFSKTYTFKFSYTGVKEVATVVDVSYNHYMDWREAHDNIPFCGYAIVDKTTTYSNGSTETATYQDYGHLPIILASNNTFSNKSDDGVASVEELYETEEEFDNVVRSRTSCLAVKKEMYDFLNYYNVEDERIITVSQNTTYTTTKEYSDYTSSKYYNDGSEWFYSLAWTKKYTLAVYFGGTPINNTSIGYQIYDQFLVIDDKYIYFDDYEPVFDFSYELKDIPSTDVPSKYEYGKLVSIICTAKLKDEVTYSSYQDVIVYVESEN